MNLSGSRQADADVVAELSAAALQSERRGRVTEAAELHRRILQVDPRNLRSLRRLGAIALATGQPANAVHYISQALGLASQDAALHNDVAIGYRALGRPDEAIRHFRQAVAIRPDYAEAHNNLGVVLQEQGRFDEALEALQEAVRLKPNYADALMNLANTLEKLDQPEKALEHYRRAIKIAPKHAEALVNNAVVLQRLGRLDEAAEALERAIKIDPEAPRPYLYLGRVRRYSQGDRHLSALQRLAKRAGALDPGRRVELHFALAKAYADVEDAAASFTELKAGNALKRTQVWYDETTRLAQFEAIRSIFSYEMLDKKTGNGVGDPSDFPIFIVGMPRSGTTLVEQVLAAHPHVHPGGELKILSQLANGARSVAGRMIPFPHFVSSFNERTAAEFGARYIGELRRVALTARHITDKMPSNFLYLGLLRLVLPNARIIHVRRHPIDTCVSCYSTLFAEGQEYTYDLAELGRYYAAYADLMAHWDAVLPSRTVLHVQYEELVGDLEGQARRIVEHCRLPWDEHCLRFYEVGRPVRTASAPQVRQPIYQSAVGRWRVYEPYLKPLLDTLGPELVARR